MAMAILLIKLYHFISTVDSFESCHRFNAVAQGYFLLLVESWWLLLELFARLIGYFRHGIDFWVGFMVPRGVLVVCLLDDEDESGWRKKGRLLALICWAQNMGVADLEGACGGTSTPVKKMNGWERDEWLSWQKVVIEHISFACMSSSGSTKQMNRKMPVRFAIPESQSSDLR